MSTFPMRSPGLFRVRRSASRGRCRPRRPGAKPCQRPPGHRAGLEILPVINKIDLPSADVESVKQQIEDVIGLDTSNTILCSAKMGIGIKEILERFSIFLPLQEPDNDESRALIFDSHYDTYRGVMVYVRVISGEITKKSLINMMASGKSFEVLEVGDFHPRSNPVDKLRPGEVGYIIANIKNIRRCQNRRHDHLCTKSPPKNLSPASA